MSIRLSVSENIIEIVFSAKNAYDYHKENLTSSKFSLQING